MNKGKIIRFIFICFIIFFLVILFANSNGYYQSKTTKARALTEEQIKIFEKDIQEGKSIDINDYITNEEKDYSNTLTNNIYKVSLKLEKAIDKTVKYIFKELGNAIEE